MCKHSEVGSPQLCDQEAKWVKGQAEREGGTGLNGLAEAHGEPWGFRAGGIDVIIFIPSNPPII